MGNQVLGSLGIKTFLQHYWQKKAHLFQQTVPDFLGFLTAKEIKQLATQKDVQSRLVIRQGKNYTLNHGPFRPIDLKGLGNKNWTLLIQSLNHWLPEADSLLQDFRFIPYARLDDIMVSYATPGGGVGPHYDHYDVFLLQGYGVRRWQIANTEDLAIRPNQSLKLLQRFKAQQTWDLEAGDMLYLPPKWAHHGIAQTECFTYSIGFRAPTYQEWVNAMLDYLRDEFQIEGNYTDPNLKEQRHPAKLPDELIDQVYAITQKIKWGKKDIANMVGRYLSEPKPHVFFDPEFEPVSLLQFSQHWAKYGLRLDAKTQILFHQAHFFINGEKLTPPINCFPLLTKLADHKILSPMEKSKQPKELTLLLHEWYTQGWLHLG
ncbi:cupin domain-containing protein [Ferrovum sp. PN-J185]|uniref:cupin domain-containing protein n=1 Tax=Ferrovum sp. PN-J185 TaxID=1356306 RepID=UPI0007933293|nr:cupin domain-containing protein [Ferrovum sp. PN-J185]KXW55298.1 50S ribosomal protein L16 arginine hydroxylase [Ferrovum sp. PN-J185]MCC6068637.1 cupin domain-containing protein [Ferrovum sp. PN-J185]MDE1891661.1 cupin domain-containing protein [Betaproteobacteria bacterium]MDE2055995.1 cupin domain-containing protein [Betaproteobacteria bacterium]